MKRFIALLAFFMADIAFAGAAPTSQTYSALHVDQFRNGTPGMLIFKDEDSNGAYMVQGNPDTGALLVEGTVNVENESVGPNGDPIPTSSTLVGGTSSGTLVPIKVASDGTVAVSGATTQSGGAYATSARNAYASVNVTTGAWVQLIASTAAVINCLTVFDSSGQTLELGIGAAASETRTLIIPPGGLNGCIPLRIAASTRISIRAISATASVGELDLTGIQ